MIETLELVKKYNAELDRSGKLLLMMMRKAYTTDLSDREWQLIEALLPSPKHLGRKIEYSRREILNAIFSSLSQRLHVAGSAWRFSSLWDSFALLSRLETQWTLASHQ